MGSLFQALDFSPIFSQTNLAILSMRDSTSISFKFNAQAPKFFPRLQSQMPISGYLTSISGGGDGGVGSDYFYIGDQQQIQLFTIRMLGFPVTQRMSSQMIFGKRSSNSQTEL